MSNTFVISFPTVFDYELGYDLISRLHKSPFISPFTDEADENKETITIKTNSDFSWFADSLDNTVIRYNLLKPDTDDPTKRYYNIELYKDDARRFKEVLRDLHIEFESSGCFNMVHFEIYCTRNDVHSINNWLNNNT